MMTVTERRRRAGVYTTGEAARLLAVTQPSVWRLIKAGRLAAYRIDRRHRIPREALLELIAGAEHSGEARAYFEAREAEIQAERDPARWAKAKAKARMRT
jgi:excisionase family DNA binding protein